MLCTHYFKADKIFHKPNIGGSSGKYSFGKSIKKNVFLIYIYMKDHTLHYISVYIMSIIFPAFVVTSHQLIYNTRFKEPSQQ